MTTLGAGFSAAGSSPAGTGDVVEADGPSANLFRDATGAQRTARAINPATGQYTFNADGSASGMTGPQQLVLLRIKTEKDKSAIPGFGKRANGAKVNERTSREVQLAIEDCLADIIANGTIELLSVDVERSAKSQIYGVAKWRDLTTNTEQQTGF